MHAPVIVFYLFSLCSCIISEEISNGINQSFSTFYNYMYKCRSILIKFMRCFFFRFFFPEIQNENFHLIDLICTNCYNYLFNTNQFYMVEKLRKYWKFLICNKVDRKQIILKQEAHGPHHSPEKTVQINKHIWLYHKVD